MMASKKCEFVQQRIDREKVYYPEKLRLFQTDIRACNIDYVDNIVLDDYFLLDQRAGLGLSYSLRNSRRVNEFVLEYFIKQKRWDLLLYTLDHVHLAPKKDIMATIEYLYYQDIPDYFEPEIRELFNLLTDAESIQVAQKLVPITKDQLNKMKEQERVLFDNWSQFDQMAYLVHLGMNITSILNNPTSFGGI